MSSTTLGVEALAELIHRALLASGVSERSAQSVTAALVAAEMDGEVGHGAARVPSYCGQARSGKVSGHATPEVTAVGSGGLRIDAKGGFAYPALDVMSESLPELARTCGVAAAAVTNSHHLGMAGYHSERLARAGVLGLVFSNSPGAMAPYGGTRAVFGTNPIGFAAPRSEGPPLVIDMGLSTVARGKIMVAARNGERIPEGWALDRDGEPTTDPEAAMDGTLLPIGGAKGSALALLVEVLAAALTGSHFGHEASSFFVAEGPPPSIGQFVIALDPEGFSAGAFESRLEELIAAIEEQPGARIPGALKAERRRAALQDGVTLTAELHNEILAIAEAPPVER